MVVKVLGDYHVDYLHLTPNDKPSLTIGFFASSLSLTPTRTLTLSFLHLQLMFVPQIGFSCVIRIATQKQKHNFFNGTNNYYNIRQSLLTNLLVYR